MKNHHPLPPPTKNVSYFIHLSTVPLILTTVMTTLLLYFNIHVTLSFCQPSHVTSMQIIETYYGSRFVPPTTLSAGKQVKYFLSR